MVSSAFAVFSNKSSNQEIAVSGDVNKKIFCPFVVGFELGCRICL